MTYAGLVGCFLWLPGLPLSTLGGLLCTSSCPASNAPSASATSWSASSTSAASALPCLAPQLAYSIAEGCNLLARLPSLQPLCQHRLLVSFDPPNLVQLHCLKLRVPVACCCSDHFPSVPAGCPPQAATSTMLLLHQYPVAPACGLTHSQAQPVPLSPSPIPCPPGSCTDI